MEKLVCVAVCRLHNDMDFAGVVLAVIPDCE